MKSGFTLIEFMLAFALSSFLLMILFGALTQSNTLLRATDEYIDRYTALTIAHHQLQKDISGACVPPQVYFDEALKTESTNPELQPLTKDIRLLNKLFVLKTENKQLQLLTFISNNPPRAYWSESIGSATPALVRVVYRLKQDEETQLPSFTLVRQSGTDLDLQEYNSGGTMREYPLLKNIKNLSVSCVHIVEQGEGEQDTKALESTMQWNSDTQNTTDTSIHYIPHGITLKLTLWGSRQENEQTYVITIPIMADSRITYTQPKLPPPIEDRKKAKSMVQLPFELPKEVTQ